MRLPRRHGFGNAFRAMRRRGHASATPLLARLSRAGREAEDASPAGEAPELVLSRVLELEVRSLEQARGRRGDQYLARLGQRGDAGDGMGGHAPDIAGVALDLARVHARADLQTVLLGAVSNRTGAPNRSRRRRRPGSRRQWSSPPGRGRTPSPWRASSSFHAKSPSRTATSVEPTMSVTSSVATTRSPDSGGLAQLRTPVNSIDTYGSSPTTLESWPGGMSKASPSREDPAGPALHLDLDLSGHDDALVMVLTRHGAGDRPHVLGRLAPRRA
jgi:hypothetical protein